MSSLFANGVCIFLVIFLISVLSMSVDFVDYYRDNYNLIYFYSNHILDSISIIFEQSKKIGNKHKLIKSIPSLRTKWSPGSATGYAPAY